VDVKCVGWFVEIVCWVCIELNMFRSAREFFEIAESQGHQLQIGIFGFLGCLTCVHLKCGRLVGPSFFCFTYFCVNHRYGIIQIAEQAYADVFKNAQVEAGWRVCLVCVRHDTCLFRWLVVGCCCCFACCRLLLLHVSGQAVGYILARKFVLNCCFDISLVIVCRKLVMMKNRECRSRIAKKFKKIL
jgi:hypothetical protein